jgi:D-arabinose 1-dehydrogenase-like Zn-dependent alcohol dehydrogenase
MQINAALERVKNGKARYRVVLDFEQGKDSALCVE